MYRNMIFFALSLFGFFPQVLAAELHVSAAISLNQAFKEIGEHYQKLHPSVKVNFNFAGSGTLLQQIAKGAPVDVFASADEETMEAAVQQGLCLSGERRNFVRNRLVLVQALDSKVKLSQLEDLKQVDRFAMGNPASVPAGRYALAALSHAKLWPQLDAKAIKTQNVRQALDYVARGEVEAGFVYATDVLTMPDKLRVSFEVTTNKPVIYPIAPVKDSPNLHESKRFISFILSPQGQTILARFGFQKPH